MGTTSVGYGVSVKLVVGVDGIIVGAAIVGVPVGTIVVGETLITGLVEDTMGDPVGNEVAVTGRLYSICNSGAPA